MKFDSIESILDDIRAGKMVVMLDDEDRENEGDLIMAGSLVKPEDINFMARYGRGLICLSLTRERCKQLGLQLMVRDTDRHHQTAFTVSIEAAEGVTTGISAFDRAHTIRVAVKADARPEDLVQPGHVFPLMAQPGGVLTRAGHTEAGCDLTRLAGLEPAAAIVEVLNEDGGMARRPDLVSFARGHGLRMCTIAQLIRYRLEKEESVEQISEDLVDTEFGTFRLVCFEDHVHQDVHLALIRGDIGPSSVPLVRVQLTDTLRDLVGVQAPQLGWPLRSAMERIAREEAGIVVLLRRHELPRELVDSVAMLSGRPLAPGDHRDGQESRVLRTYGIGAQILRNLGVRRMRVLSAPKQMYGLSGFGLEVVDYVNQ